MEKIRREVECLNRLQVLNNSYDDILAFLFSENLVTREDIRVIRSSPDIGKLLQLTMAKLSKESKLQLLEYTWEILPVERIKILIVTDRNNREFSYNF
jgi:hypothetical protein